MPDFPYGLKVRRNGITGRFIGALLSPKPMASMILPACLLSFGSKVSMWLMPPHMNRKMTDFARGVPGKAGIRHQLAVLRPERAERRAQESGRGLEQKPPPRDPAAGIEFAQAHLT